MYITTPLLQTQHLKSWDLTPRQFCDLEMLLSGAFAPLQGFMNAAEYHQLLNSGQSWLTPVLLDVTPGFANNLSIGETIALRDAEGVLLAVFTVEGQFRATPPDSGTTDGVCLEGQLQGITLPKHHHAAQERQTPAQVQTYFREQGCQNVIAVLPQQAIHRLQWESACSYAKTLQAGILVQAAIGLAHPEDPVHFTRFRCYRQVLQRCSTPVQLNLLNHASRGDPLQEMLLRTLMLRNFGVTHLLVTRAQADTLTPHIATLGLKLLIEPAPPAEEIALRTYRDVELSHHMHQCLSVPAEFSYPEVLAELQRSYPPRHRQGFVVFFTGLSGSGKSTLANVLLMRLMEIGGRSVTLLDGDVVRKHLSSELNFSKEHRDINVRRIGFVASEIAKSGGIAICAPIAPYTQVRREVRQLVSDKGGFLEVHVATPLSECEKRDTKGLYAKARAGILKGFTGIDDPYEIPENPEVCLNTSHRSPAECVNQILQCLIKMGYLPSSTVVSSPHSPKWHETP